MPDLYMDPTAFREFLSAINERDKIVEKLRRSDIRLLFATNNSYATFEAKFNAKLFRTLEIRPESLELANPANFIRVSRASVEKAGYIMNIKDIPAKKITFELDLLTGHGIASVE